MDTIHIKFTSLTTAYRVVAHSTDELAAVIHRMNKAHKMASKRRRAEFLAKGKHGMRRPK